MNELLKTTKQVEMSVELLMSLELESQQNKANVSIYLQN